MNIRGASMEPWGMALITGLGFDEELSISVHCVQVDRHDCNQITKDKPKPKCLKFQKKYTTID